MNVAINESIDIVEEEFFDTQTDPTQTFVSSDVGIFAGAQPIESSTNESSENSLNQNYQSDNSDEDQDQANVRTEKFEQSAPKNIYRFKLGVIVIVMFIFVYALFIPPMPLEQVACVSDKVMDGLQPQYDYFEQNPSNRDTSLMLIGAMTDILLLCYMCLWTMKGGSWRFMMTLFFVYFLRQIFESLYKLQAPQPNQWKYPGLYSLTIGYEDGRYFYFNTALSICMALFQEYQDQGLSVLSFFCLVAMFGNCYMSLVLKGHYLIDNFAGIAFGYYIWQICDKWLSYYIDVRIFGMTLHERTQSLQTKCQSCSCDINKYVQDKQLKQQKQQM